MLYPQNFETKIGFDRIREILREYSLGPLGIVNLEQISFRSEPDFIHQALDRTFEFTKILTQKLEYPRSGYLDCSDFLDRIPIDGIFLSQDEFYDLKVTVNTLSDWYVFLKENAESFPELTRLGSLLNLDKQTI